MAYFNHAFRKTFMATKGDQAAVGTPGNANAVVPLTGGIITVDNIPVWQLKSTAASEGYQLGPGTTGFFDAKTNLSLAPSSFATATKCCNFYIASASIKQKDKQGPYHGGYLESNKSKMINPKYLTKFWTQASNAAGRAVMEIGGTPANIAVNADCGKEFLCEETYYLRIDVKGTAALRFANHNLYQTLSAYGGCCPDPAAPTAVDPATIYLQWAEQIAGLATPLAASDDGNPYLKDFVRPLVTVTTGAGTQTYAQNAEIALEEGLTANDIWANIPTTGVTAAGLILVGAYVDTTFSDCTFQVSDYYGKEPIQMFASEVDLNGDPCAFSGLCVSRSADANIDGLGTGCEGKQPNGLGESVARDVILHEEYLQNFFASDLRIREITQGTDIFSIPGFSRDGLYDRGFMLHSVPRFNNPTGVFDNDQYLVEVIGNADTMTQIGTVVTGLATAGCTTCLLEEAFDQTACVHVVPVITP